jgi:hypothetical protein
MVSLMKVALHILFALVVASGLALGGSWLWLQGTRERAQLMREDHIDPGPSDCPGRTPMLMVRYWAAEGLKELGGRLAANGVKMP